MQFYYNMTVLFISFTPKYSRAQLQTYSTDTITENVSNQEKKVGNK